MATDTNHTNPQQKLNPILSEEERKRAETMQAEKRAEFGKLSPLALLARLRALFSDVSAEQSARDDEFLKHSDDEN